MDGRSLCNALHAAQRVYGTHLVSPSPHWPEAPRGVKLDFVFLDTDHIAVDRTTLAWMRRAYRAQGIAPLMRIPSPDPDQETMVLDGGADGVIGPYVESSDEVRALTCAGRSRVRGIQSDVHAFYLRGLEHEKRWIELGANPIVPGADVLAMQRSSARNVGELRAGAGDGGATGGGEPRVRAAGDDA